MNKQQAYAMGKERGYNIASWQDSPRISAKVDKSLDWAGMGDFVTAENVADYFFAICQDAESNDRQYSPFEFTARDFNECPNAESLWDEFDKGIEKGFADNWNERKEYYE